MTINESRPVTLTVFIPVDSEEYPSDWLDDRGFYQVPYRAGGSELPRDIYVTWGQVTL